MAGISPLLAIIKTALTTTATTRVSKPCWDGTLTTSHLATYQVSPTTAVLLAMFTFHFTILPLNIPCTTATLNPLLNLRIIAHHCTWIRNIEAILISTTAFKFKQMPISKARMMNDSIVFHSAMTYSFSLTLSGSICSLQCSISASGSSAEVFWPKTTTSR